MDLKVLLEEQANVMFVHPYFRTEADAYEESNNLIMRVYYTPQLTYIYNTQLV